MSKLRVRPQAGNRPPRKRGSSPRSREPPRALSDARRDALAALLPRLHEATLATWWRVRWLLAIEDAEDVMRGASVDAAIEFDPARCTLDRFVVFRTEAAIIDAARRAANKLRVELAIRSAMRRAFADVDSPNTWKRRQRFYDVGIAAAVLAFVQVSHPEGQLSDREQHERTMKALEEARCRLKPRARRLLDLYYAEEGGLTLDEVAKRLRVSGATARNAHRTALAKLGAILRARGISYIDSRTR